VEPLDPGVSLDQRLDNLRIDLIVRCLPLVLGHCNLIQLAILLCKVTECSVPLVLYPPDNLGDGSACILEARLPGRKPCIDLNCLPHSANSFAMRDC
jgi:hypothetical protein